MAAKHMKEKHGDWMLKSLEDNLKSFLVPRVPSFIETYHLTWMTLLWSGLVVACFALAIENQQYLWGIPVLVVFQYLTDLLDGAVGRHRDTGLVKWGYYTDHFLDFIFQSSILFGYGLLLGFSGWLFILFGILSAGMVHSFLFVAAHKEFQISVLGLGPTEGRLIFILGHSLFVYVDIFLVTFYLPYLVGFGLLAIAFVFVRAQFTLWEVDMNKKTR